MRTVGEIQLGKNGITENFIETLNKYFKNHGNVRISVLKSAFPENIEKGKKNIVKKYSDEILERLGNKYTSRVIGFTIVVKKWRKEVR